MTAPSSHINSTDEDESKGIIMHETLSHGCSTYEDVSKGIIVNKTLSQSCFVDTCSTEEDKSEFAIKKQKEAKTVVTYDGPNYFNAFNVLKHRRNIYDRLAVSYERACMVTEREVYFTKMLDSLLVNSECHGTLLPREKLQESVSRVMEDNVNNITMDTLFHSPLTINVQNKYANVTSERRIAADIHAESIENFMGFMIQSTISNSEHSNSEELFDAVSDSEELVDAISDPERDSSCDPKVASHATNRHFHKNYSTTGLSQIHPQA